MSPRPPVEKSGKAFTLETVFAGLRYVRGTRLLLGSISLDLFAVLLGGAVALMPVFARDVLHEGAKGLGLLRAMPELEGMTLLRRGRLSVQPVEDRYWDAIMHLVDDES